MRNFLTGVILLDRQPLHPPQCRAGQTPARRSPARLALVELSGLRPPAAARWMGGLRGFAFGLAWRVGRQRSPEAAYRRFVEQGLARAPANPFQSAAHGWLLGSATFIERMRSLLSEPRNQDEVPAARQLASLDAAIVLAEVARYYGVDQDCFQVRRSGLLGRDLAAWLVRHHSSATLRELAPIFGLNHPDITLAPKKLIRTRRASEGSASEPSLARRVNPSSRPRRHPHGP